MTKNFFIKPQAIILLYDITSKESFDSIIKYYNELKEDKNFVNVKYILVGNKIDLIEEINIKEENDNNNNKNYDKNVENEENKKNIENEENKEHKEKEESKENNIKIMNNNININYYKQNIDKENFDLIKDISGLNGFYLEDLLNETALLLYNLVKLMENTTNELYQIERDSIIIENKLEINKGQTSYHDIEYKNEVNKINKSTNKACCLLCNIF